MRQRKHRRFGWAMGGTLCLAALLLTGCVRVEMVDTTPAVVSPGTITSPLPVDAAEHDMGILGVEFDPPLDRVHSLLPRQTVTLLVAVENTGRATERAVTVQAELSSLEDPQFLLTRQATVDSIAPGEVQVVRFPPLENVPRHMSYHLEVRLAPLAGEGDVSDNRRAFDIQILPESPNP